MRAARGVVTRTGKVAALAAVLAFLMSGCIVNVTSLFGPGGRLRPFYCDPTDTAINDGHAGDGTFDAVYTEEKGPLSASDCEALKDDIDAARSYISQWDTVGDLPANWVQAAVWSPGQGIHYVDTNRITGPFDPTAPNWLMADGTSPDSKITGMMFLEQQPGGMNSVPPAGFPGDNDHWHRHHELCYKDNSIPFIVGEHLSDAQCAALGGVNQMFMDQWMVHVWLPMYDDWVPTDIFNKTHPSIP